MGSIFKAFFLLCKEERSGIRDTWHFSGWGGGRATWAKLEHQLQQLGTWTLFWERQVKSPPQGIHNSGSLVTLQAWVFLNDWLEDRDKRTIFNLHHLLPVLRKDTLYLKGMYWICDNHGQAETTWDTDKGLSSKPVNVTYGKKQHWGVTGHSTRGFYGCELWTQR